MIMHAFPFPFLKPDTLDMNCIYWYYYYNFIDIIYDQQLHV